MKEILLVEDDCSLNRGLCIALSNEQMNVVSCYDLNGVNENLKKKYFDLEIFIFSLSYKAEENQKYFIF